MRLYTLCLLFAMIPYYNLTHQEQGYTYEQIAAKNALMDGEPDDWLTQLEGAMK